MNINVTEWEYKLLELYKKLDIDNQLSVYAFALGTVKSQQIIRKNLNKEDE